MRAMAEASLELFHACHCLLEILVFQQGLLDEALQFLIMKELPPWKIGDGLPFRFRHAKSGRGIDQGPGIIRSQGAGGEQQA